MFVVVADGKAVFVTDVDDVAWDTSQEMIEGGEHAHAYVEEVYEKDFGENGLYRTTEGDIISLEDVKSAERFMREEE